MINKVSIQIKKFKTIVLFLRINHARDMPIRMLKQGLEAFQPQRVFYNKTSESLKHKIAAEKEGSASS